MNNGFLEDFKNAWNKPNNAVVQLIIINVVVFVAINIVRVFMYFSGNMPVYEAVVSYLAIPPYLPQILGRPWTIITYMFVHEGFFHILFNMLFLYWFGKIIQEFLGSKKVIGLYVTGGLTGALLYIFLYNVLPNFENVLDSSQMIGASAGVYAIVVGAAVFMPNYTMFLLLFGPVRIKYIALIFVLLSFFDTTGSNAGGQFAHLGGALMGWLFITQLRKGNDLGSWVISTIQFIKSFFISQPKIKVTHRKGTANNRRKTSGAGSSDTSQEEIDAILDKISQGGYDSLTTEEKQKLFNASKK